MLTLKTVTTLNPAILLPTPTAEPENDKLNHDCLETLETVYSSRLDLTDKPLPEPDWELFVDGSSCIKGG